MELVACIDIGTVTCRLAVAEVDGGRVGRLAKRSVICNLGEGLGATGAISDASCGRVLGSVDAYLQMARQLGATHACCTLTSAARDASNVRVILDGLRIRGLEPQVISGEVEGSLTFLGVAQDFRGQRILVADNGGGSTELAVGSLGEGLRLDLVRSTDVGCRRITERFLSLQDPPSAEDMAVARGFAEGLFAPALEDAGLTRAARGLSPDVLVVTGGTATSLVAVKKALVPYDPAQVHLAQLSREEVEGLCERLSGLTMAKRAQLPGLQPQRAEVILGGALAIAELMRLSGFGRLTVSESDLLFGLALCAADALAGAASRLGWTPRMRPLL